MPKNKNIEDRIVDLLYIRDEALKAYQISKEINESPQITDYNVKKLVKKKVLVPVVDGKSTYYRLQGVFYVERAGDALMASLIPFVKIFSQEIEAEGEDRLKVVYENLKHYFRVVIKDFKKDLNI